jgi:Spy/CpxP family protein refolding chaperone
MSYLLKLLAALCALAVVLGAQQKPALTPEQRLKVEQIVKDTEERAKTDAATLALKAAELVSGIDRNLLSEKPDQELDRKLSAELEDTLASLVRAAIRGRLAAVHELAKVLTPEQKKLAIAELDKPGSGVMGMQDLIEKVFGK